MKTNLESMVQQTFKGKYFVKSEFHGDNDMMYDIFDQETITAGELVGRKIVKASVDVMEREDAGLSLTFEGIDNPLFFHSNCNITVKD